MSLLFCAVCIHGGFKKVSDTYACRPIPWRPDRPRRGTQGVVVGSL
jgi:hypothetical protein